MARVFIAIGAAPEQIAGFYSLSAASLERPTCRLCQRSSLRYPVPAVVIGRLAIDLRSWQGRGLGETLLLDAMRRTLRASAAIAVYAMIVDAKHERARSFYERYGFRSFTTAADRLFMPLETFEKLGLRGRAGANGDSFNFANQLPFPVV